MSKVVGIDLGNDKLYCSCFGRRRDGDIQMQRAVD